jgi:hypothetical protein
MSDIVFLRCWYPVKPVKFYTVCATLLQQDKDVWEVWLSNMPRETVFTKFDEFRSYCIWKPSSFVSMSYNDVEPDGHFGRACERWARCGETPASLYPLSRILSTQPWRGRKESSIP